MATSTSPDLPAQIACTEPIFPSPEQKNTALRVKFSGCTFLEVLAAVFKLLKKNDPIQVAKLRSPGLIEMTLTYLADVRVLLSTTTFPMPNNGNWEASDDENSSQTTPYKRTNATNLSHGHWRVSILWTLGNT